MDRGRLSIPLLSFYGVETGYIGEITRCQISSIELRETEREKKKKTEGRGVTAEMETI